MHFMLSLFVTPLVFFMFLEYSCRESQPTFAGIFFHPASKMYSRTEKWLTLTHIHTHALLVMLKGKGDLSYILTVV